MYSIHPPDVQFQFQEVPPAPDPTSYRVTKTDTVQFINPVVILRSFASSKTEVTLARHVRRTILSFYLAMNFSKVWMMHE